MTKKSALGEPVGDCPGCGRAIAVSMDPPAMLHQLPQCDAFRERGPVEYMKWVNDQRGRPS